MRLSDHFYLYEMTQSQLARHHNITNQPNAGQIDALRHLCVEALEPVRRHFSVPIVLSSGFRTMALNRLLGSQDSRSHCAGEAVDFEVIGVGNLVLVQCMRESLVFDQFILEYPQADDESAGRFYMSYKRSENRPQCLTRHQNGYARRLPRLQNVLQKFPKTQKT